jgi:choline dehydrogenase-like flavoprotein
MKTITTDVLVIGTGFGAAAPALRLALAGAKVIMIEKGPRVQTADFRQTSDPKYILKYLKGASGDNLQLTYAEALGGGSAFYEMVSLRAPSPAFQQLDDAGRPLWPDGVDRRALDPYYDVAERMLHVSQIPVEEVPKTGLVFAQLMKNLGYSVDRCRYAVRGCQGSGFCVTGCVYGAKQSLFLNYLPQAVAAGAEIETDLEALAIEPLAARWRAGSALRDIPYRYRVTARRRTGAGELVTFVARVVILGGGAVGTAKLLLASRPYLPHLSEHVGRNIAYNGSVKVAALLPQGAPDADMFTGRTHPGMVSYQFLGSHGITVHAVKAMPLMLVSAAHLRLSGEPHADFWGPGNVELMRQLRHRMIILDAFGLTPPGAALELTAGEARVSLPITAQLRAYHAETKRVLESILVRNGCRIVEADFLDKSFAPQHGIHFSTAHQVGSCRMADSGEHGVVDASGAVFGYPGLYVSDGAAIPSALAVNTSLTILANAVRIAGGLLERYRPAAPGGGAQAA